MDSRQLRYFIAVYEQRNLSRAADQANVAQSALSHHIANLEAEFATPLFERKPRGMEPTAAGERLYEHARIILRAMAAAEREIREGRQRDRRRHLSIGMANSGMKAIGVPLMRTVLTKYTEPEAVADRESLRRDAAAPAELRRRPRTGLQSAVGKRPGGRAGAGGADVLRRHRETDSGRKAPISFEEVARLPLILLRHGLSARRPGR